MELNDSQIDELNDFVKEVDNYVNGYKIEERYNFKRYALNLHKVCKKNS